MLTYVVTYCIPTAVPPRTSKVTSTSCLIQPHFITAHTSTDRIHELSLTVNSLCCKPIVTSAEKKNDIQYITHRSIKIVGAMQPQTPYPKFLQTIWKCQPDVAEELALSIWNGGFTRWYSLFLSSFMQKVQKWPSHCQARHFYIQAQSWPCYFHLFGAPTNLSYPTHSAHADPISIHCRKWQDMKLKVSWHIYTSTMRFKGLT